MILRKPYAFLIKYFKLIHAILFLGILYVTIKNINLSVFFGNYISNNKEVSLYENLASSYVNSVLIIILLSIILLSGVVLYLMKYKKKPILFYAVNLVIYTITLLMFFYASSFFYDAQFTPPDLRFTKILRDVYFTMIFVHVGTLILSFIRMTGFDIKKFDFQKDVMDFDMSSEDREEFEFELNIDTEDLKAKIRKNLRILKYNYKENKLIFLGVFGLIGIILLSIVFDFIFNRERIYKEGQSFTTNSYKIEVLDSYKTFNDARGTEVSSSNFYVILKLKYKNISGRIIEKINLSNIKLKVDDFYMVEPNTLLNNRFGEFGETYYSQSLDNNEERIFTIIYEVNKDSYNKNLSLKYLYNVLYENNEVSYKYRTVKLKPKTFDKIENISTKKLGEEFVFEDSVLGNTKLKVNNVKINQNFMYKAKYCDDNKCITKFDTIVPSFSNKYELSVMRIDYNLVFDKNYLGNNYRNNKFFEKFGNIRFTIDGKEYNHRIELKDITPFLTDGYAFVEVRSRINEAEKILLDLVIRDKVYTYIIKEKTT